MQPARVRLHLVGEEGTLEGLLLKRPRRLGGFYKIVDAAFLETHIDRHPLDNLATVVPREKVRFEEALKP